MYSESTLSMWVSSTTSVVSSTAPYWTRVRSTFSIVATFEAGVVPSVSTKPVASVGIGSLWRRKLMVLVEFEGSALRLPICSRTM